MAAPDDLELERPAGNGAGCGCGCLLVALSSALTLLAFYGAVVLVVRLWP